MCKASVRYRWENLTAFSEERFQSDTRNVDELYRQLGADPVNRTVGGTADSDPEDALM